MTSRITVGSQKPVFMVPHESDYRPRRGILEMKKIAAMADAYHVPFCPHNYLGPISTMANIQVCTCVPNFMVLEFQGGDIDWRDTIFDEPIPLKNGYLEVPSKPGLGVELNREELAKHLV